MAERCPRCNELHTAWVMVRFVNPKNGEETIDGCQYCRLDTDVMYEMGVPVTRAEDRLEAEAEEGRHEH